MDRWFPSTPAREQVYELLADAIDTANNLAPRGGTRGT